MNKKFLIVNDIPGAGKVAGNINMPILSAAGFETAILPTLILTTETGTYDPDKVLFHRLGEDFQKMLDTWVELDINFQHFLTGYFAHEDQVSSFRDYFVKVKESNPDAKLFVDPIMADGGDFYPGFNQNIAQAFENLIAHADFILPNTTEACLLTGLPYKVDLNRDELEEMCDIFLKWGCKYACISGIRFPDTYPEQIGFYIKGQDLPGQWIYHKYYEQTFQGTGDVVFSSIVGLYAQGYSIVDAIEMTGPFIEDVFEKTIALKRDNRFGLYFEDSLGYFLKKGD